jgi:hypothetical protein
MAIQAEFAYVGVPRASYDSMIPMVEAKLRAAPGFMAHLAAETADGFHVTEVWESEAALRTWLREVIAPVMAKAGGTAPEPTIQPLHHAIVNGTRTAGVPVVDTTGRVR